MADELFLSSVKKLTAQNLSINELLETAEKLKSADGPDLVIQLYKLWIKFNPDSPMRPYAYFNQAVSQSDSGDLAGAKSALEAALALNPDFYPAYINLGTALEKLGATGDAVIQWSTLAARLAAVTGNAIDYRATALKQIGRVLETNLLAPNAEKALKQSLEINQNQIDVVQHFIALRLTQCKWPVVSPWEHVGRKTLMTGIGPLSMAAYTDDPMLQLASGWNYNKHTVGYPYADFEMGGGTSCALARPGRRRIGYVSSDLREHAVGFIMAEVFELHDREKFEVFVYYCGIAAKDALHARIKNAVEHWVDINALDDRAAAQRIAADGIDILIDVNGYTKDARTKTFALRPAPVIVNWLGYPGSMGSPYHNYIIADDWVVPKDYEIYYSEKVMRLPCYQANDRKRIVAPQMPTRRDAGLPEQAMVFCCFNGAQKISQFTFERWLTILQRVPASVLWLLDGAEASNKRLQEFAAARGIAPERLIFAGKLANPHHLARYPLADLFLDTSPYGAHVTASDALWMGVPILTLSGRSFASRVCGSLTRAAGLPEMVCATPEEYVERAVELGSDKAAIQKLKKRLAENRDTCVLFDTVSLVRRLEALYGQMWTEYRQGRLPRPDLTNLELYLEVGCEQDHDAVEVRAVEDYQAWYRERFARRHRYCPIPEDRRLWTADIRTEAERVNGGMPTLELKDFSDDEFEEEMPVLRRASGKM